MARKKKEPNLKAFLFNLVLLVVVIIVVYLAFMNSASSVWIREHIMKPIFAPIFKNFGIILK
jgi:hypothetical protein